MFQRGLYVAAFQSFLWNRMLATLIRIERRMLQIKYPRDTYFARGHRSATFTLANLTHTTTDDLSPGRHNLTLGFDLSHGAYATMVIKQLIATTRG
jgi:tRNA(Glu) U13 pseudouridine synthase TruD